MVTTILEKSLQCSKIVRDKYHTVIYLACPFKNKLAFLINYFHSKQLHIPQVTSDLTDLESH